MFRLGGGGFFGGQELRLKLKRVSKRSHVGTYSVLGSVQLFRGDVRKQLLVFVEDFVYQIVQRVFICSASVNTEETSVSVEVGKGVESVDEFLGGQALGQSAAGVGS